MGEISARRIEKTRWVLSRVPNESFAQQSEMTLSEIMEFYFESIICDWDELITFMNNVKKLYTSGSLVRIIGKETDISFSTEGRHYLLGDGSANMPDGEIYTSPVEDSVNGHIFFEFPGVYAGKTIHRKLKPQCQVFKS